jgi:hypothetical protein
MALRLRRPAESSGQPAPAGIEPGPLEVAERDNALPLDARAEILADEAHAGGRAQGLAEQPPPGLLEDPSLRLYRLLSGQYRHTITGSANVPIGGTNEVPLSEEVRAGMIFIIRAIRVQAPAGAKLQLFQDQVTPTNFREVITNVQEWSGEPPGTLVIRGQSRLRAIITGTTAEGLAVVRLEGDLVKREPVTT